MKNGRRRCNERKRTYRTGLFRPAPVEARMRETAPTVIKSQKQQQPNIVFVQYKLFGQLHNSAVIPVKKASRLARNCRLLQMVWNIRILFFYVHEIKGGRRRHVVFRRLSSEVKTLQAHQSLGWGEEQRMAVNYLEVTIPSYGLIGKHISCQIKKENMPSVCISCLLYTSRCV